MRVYAVIHSVESLDEGYSETSVKFFDHAKGAWDEMQSIQDFLDDWDDASADSFDRDYGDSKVAVPRIEWGETRRSIYNDPFGDLPAIGCWSTTKSTTNLRL